MGSFPFAALTTVCKDKGQKKIGGGYQVCTVAVLIRPKVNSSRPPSDTSSELSLFCRPPRDQPAPPKTLAPGSTALYTPPTTSRLPTYPTFDPTDPTVLHANHHPTAYYTVVHCSLSLQPSFAANGLSICRPRFAIHRPTRYR